MIDGSEGRKDPFYSIFSFMKEPPMEIFYDFACSLSEYSLNREPGYFRNVRLWHDVFHSFSHKCGTNYRSKRIPSLRYLDTEVCEQFNAYIQCIKYTATHLNLSHFTFFLQFMIDLWNRKKTEAFQRKIECVIDGHD